MKTLILPDDTTVHIRKSKRSRRLTLKLTHDGVFEASVPYFIPYTVAEKFIVKHYDWIQSNKPAEIQPLTSGKRIGTHHQLQFVLNQKHLSSRVNEQVVAVSVPVGRAVEDPAVQAEAKKASIRALRRQAEAYLPTQLYVLASRHGYNYKQAQVKKMRSRWGSCSSAKNISLSIWLMQLPEELIEYVLCHELTHLNQLNHSQQFWAELATMIPDYKQRRQRLKSYSPRLM